MLAPTSFYISENTISQYLIRTVAQTHVIWSELSMLHISDMHIAYIYACLLLCLTLFDKSFKTCISSKTKENTYHNGPHDFNRLIIPIQCTQEVWLSCEQLYNFNRWTFLEFNYIEDCNFSFCEGLQQIGESKISKCRYNTGRGPANWCYNSDTNNKTVSQNQSFSLRRHLSYPRLNEQSSQ